MSGFNKHEHQRFRVIFVKNGGKLGKNTSDRVGFVDSGASDKKSWYKPKYRHLRAKIDSKDSRYSGRLPVWD